ncbi:putative Xaa-Pro aminopeptidase [Choiromyces venosus 120613-1]|uniref:Xaa-Pro aminopeptidase n=1 Tax=Choiromyces venosus 120613-1 TaxID=1336337 RepID=A0A3N4J4S7_9PEZI|nr:putative Xaa-Pro aminopeptidase [Choiromyces venosus 120613-1]
MASDLAVDKILAGKYPAKQHAENVVKHLREAHPDLTDGVVYLESQKLKLHENCDQEVPFRQRRFFYYLSGCDLADSYLTYSIRDKKLTLFIPPIDPASVLWSGLPLSSLEALEKYDVDEVLPTTTTGPPTIASTSQVFVIKSQTSRTFSAQNAENLEPAIERAREIKDEYEVALIKKANLISTLAHHACLRAIKSAGNEREIEAIFTRECIANGAPKQAYSGIFGSGRSASTLHYVHNDQPLAGKLNLLLDAGAEYNNYASDITRTFPINGHFTKESREVYDVVLDMQKQCLAASNAGAVWDDIHILAHKVAIQGLLKIGILKGGSVDEILENRTSTAFLPHGLGHYLGMDTHDCGGNPNYGDPDPMFKYLRKRGPLPAGAVITVEPGIYFCEFIINPYLEDEKHAKYIDKDVLNKYWDVGGVRIEDNILITEGGYENLTNVVKEVDDMLKLING